MKSLNWDHWLVREGGRLIFQGSLVELQKLTPFTTRVLKQPLRLNQDPLAWTEYFAIKDATANNLKQVNTKSLRES